MLIATSRFDNKNIGTVPYRIPKTYRIGIRREAVRGPNIPVGYSVRTVSSARTGMVYYARMGKWELEAIR
jgi:hypothetical protein